MFNTRSVYEACHELFEKYPKAVRAANISGTVCLMVLLAGTNGSERFYILSRDCRPDRPGYRLRQWRTEREVEITPDGQDLPDVAVAAVTSGVPLPQDAYLFGWKDQDRVTALIVFYTRPARERPEPTWAVMPLAGTPTTHWPPFADESALGHWFWDYYRVGSVVSLEDVVRANPDTVFWVDTRAALGSDCCVVARDVPGPRFTLPSGRYVYQRALRLSKPVPALLDLLADRSKTDLAARFRSPARDALPKEAGIP